MRHFILLMLAIIVMMPLAACSEESDNQNGETQTTEAVITDEASGDTVIVDDTVAADGTVTEDVVATDSAATDESASALTTPADETAASDAAASSVASGFNIVVLEPYALETAEHQTTGAVFLTLENTGADADALIAAFSPAAAKVELHTHSAEGHAVAMRPVASIEVPANGSVSLNPTGDHIMLMDLSAPLQPGASFPMTLEFEKSGKKDIQVVVKPLAEAAP